MTTETHIRNQITKQVQRIPPYKLNELIKYLDKLEQEANKRKRYYRMPGYGKKWMKIFLKNLQMILLREERKPIGGTMNRVMIDKQLEDNKSGNIMQRERTTDEIIIRLPSYTKLESIENLLDYLAYSEATSRSEATQEVIDELAKEVKNGWWQQNRDRLFN